MPPEPLASALLIPLAIAAALVLLPVVAISFALTASVRALSNPKLRLHEASRTAHHDLFAAAAEHHGWATENRYEWVGAYLIRAPQEIFIAAWRRADAPRYFCIYTHLQNRVDYYDFVTEYEGGRSLTTSGTHDAHTLPFPDGNWVQSFHGADLETLWARHVEGEEYLARQHAVRLDAPREDFANLVIEALHAQMAHVRAIPLWPIRGVGWYLARKRKSNRTIAEQEA